MKTSKTQVNCSFYGKITADSFNALKSFDNLDIVLYKTHLPAYANIVADLYKFLDPKEIHRAKGYSKEKDKNRFIIFRGLLKFVLSIHTKWDVSQIKLDYHTYKKPYLPSHPFVFFNVTHSEDFGLIALANRAIGVDIEPIFKNNELVNSLQHIYSAVETSFIQNASDKNYAFYTLWTRKEAFVKALGKGIDANFSKIPSMNGLHSIDSSLLQPTVAGKYKVLI